MKYMNLNTNDFLSNKVNINFNMFGSMMLNRVASQVGATYMLVEDGHAGPDELNILRGSG